MMKPKISFPSYVRYLYFQRRCFNAKPESIVIASAVRTPWCKYQGQLASVSASWLGREVLEAAVKQSAIPIEQIQKIYMAETPLLSEEDRNEICFSNFLKKTTYTFIKTNEELSIEPILMGIQALQSKEYSAVLVGGLESATQHKSTNLTFLDISSESVRKYVLNSEAKYLKLVKERLFDAELVPVAVKKQLGNKRIVCDITQDEVVSENLKQSKTILKYSDGASALALTTAAKAQELNLTPFAVITEFECIRNSSTMLSTTTKCIETLLAKSQLNPNLIKHWEIEDCIPQLVVSLKQRFDLHPDLINPQGGSFIIGHSAAASVPRIITHLTHSLNSSDYGCIVSFNCQKSLAIIIKKLPSISSDRLPLLTLYTKNPCPLCDILVDELELNFPEEYKLEKVFIDTKENVRYLRLYRNDIPVVFLNNQFLCMHRLNKKLLRRKLDLLKNKQ